MGAMGGTGMAGAMGVTKSGASPIRPWMRKGMPVLVLPLLFGAIPRGDAEPPALRWRRATTA